MDRQEFIFKIIFNSIFFIVLAINVFFVGEVFYERKIKKKIYGAKERFEKKQKLKNKNLKIKVFKELHSNLEEVLIEKNKPEKLDLYFNIISIIIFVSMMFLFFQSQIVLATATPFILVLFINKILKLMKEDIHERLESQLPLAIDNIIRISTKYSDMRTIIYESSLTLKEPLKQVFSSMAIQMNSNAPETVLMEYAYKFDNVWFYSLVFTLISYLQDSNRDDTVMNLRTLRNMLEKENNLKKKNQVEKKGNIAINRMIAIIAVIGFVANLIFLPDSQHFFFSTIPGLICFLLGFSFLGLTVVANVLMSKERK